MPQRNAFFADIGSFVSIILRARLRPISLGSKWVDPRSGARPMRLNTCIKLADSAAIVRLPRSANAHPAPAATPFTAVITGTLQFFMACRVGKYPFIKAVTTSSPCGGRLCKSCPEQKARPAPVMMSALMLLSDSTMFIADAISAIMEKFRAFSACCRLSVRMAMPESTVNSIVSK